MLELRKIMEDNIEKSIKKHSFILLATALPMLIEWYLILNAPQSGMLGIIGWALFEFGITLLQLSINLASKLRSCYCLSPL